MDTTIKALLNALVYAVIFLILSVIVLPSLIRHLPTPQGRAVYAVLSAVGAVLAVRLRLLAKRL